MTQIQNKYNAKTNTKKDLELINNFLHLKEQAQIQSPNNLNNSNTCLINSNNFKAQARVYEWVDNSCSIGISQNYENIKKQYPNISDDDFTKRITGGGILFHGHDISYSIVLTLENFKNQSVKQSYAHICNFLFKFYSSLGLNATFAYKNKNIKLSYNSFCQEGFEAYDILIDNKKIGGNAQKRTKNYIFQQGSIGLHPNPNLNSGYCLNDFNINLNPQIAKTKLAFCIDEFMQTLI